MHQLPAGKTRLTVYIINPRTVVTGHKYVYCSSLTASLVACLNIREAGVNGQDPP
jgi:hypothetical protein